MGEAENAGAKENDHDAPRKNLAACSKGFKVFIVYRPDREFLDPRQAIGVLAGFVIPKPR